VSIRANAPLHGVVLNGFAADSDGFNIHQSSQSALGSHRAQRIDSATRMPLISTPQPLQ
jgi:hypothetical protein